MRAFYFSAYAAARSAAEKQLTDRFNEATGWDI
jgi:hypothetical protein